MRKKKKTKTKIKHPTLVTGDKEIGFQNTLASQESPVVLVIIKEAKAK